MKKFFENHPPEKISAWMGMAFMHCVIVSIVCIILDVVFFAEELPPTYPTEIVSADGIIGVFVEIDK